MYCKLVLALALVGIVSAAIPWEAAPRTDDWWQKRHEGLLALTKAHALEEVCRFYLNYYKPLQIFYTQSTNTQFCPHCNLCTIFLDQI